MPPGAISKRVRAFHKTVSANQDFWCLKVSVPSMTPSHCIPSVGHHWRCISVQPLPPCPTPTPESVLTVLKESQIQPESSDGVEARCWAAHVARSVIPVSCVELLVPASGDSTGSTHTCRLGFPKGSEARRAGSKRYG